MNGIYYQVRTTEGEIHSSWSSYRDARDQADLIHGDVSSGPLGVTNREAYEYACGNQGYEGTYEDWRMLDDEERDDYERASGGTCTGDRQ